MRLTGVGIALAAGILMGACSSEGAESLATSAGDAGPTSSPSGDVGSARKSGACGALPSPRASETRPGRDHLSYVIADLGVTTSQGSRLVMNNAGQVAGDRLGDGPGGPFRWDASAGIQDLGTLGGDGSYASVVDINEAGQVSGAADIDGRMHPVLWDPKKGIQELKPPRGADETAMPGWATAVNEEGLAVGFVEPEQGGPQALRWDPKNGPKAFGEATDGTTAEDVNNKGQIVVSPNFGGSERHSFVWGPGPERQDIGEGSSWRINEAGQVVGWTLTDAGDCSFLWDPKLGSRIYLGIARAYAINDAGQVAGTYRTGKEDDEGWSAGDGPGSRAFIWDASTGLTDLGALPGATWAAARDINAHGQVVGSSGGDSGGTWRHAFLWSLETGMQDLGTLEADDISLARAVNDSGQIIGWSGRYEEDIDGEALGKVVLWTPQ